MRAFVVKPVPVTAQQYLGRILQHNRYRFVFYAYGTTEYNPPHYALYVYGDWNILADIYLSEYIMAPL